ncbi:cytochrome P450 oxidoreductase GliC-like [Aspergillus bombycis]|uniref:Cytochrome P450 oxidoreductase GliC-like n=1 Tax=Aspergillus bombycis TaxID=109264 RepID=A0A1F8A137_9EURO|nr:cytochrome P450 oxidoreductase GliC-like [Aspergillus bombycis]OGM45413.1 cytochrome P450 oxidoreductase GliC-like [Aspergillus bombycis]
MLATPNLGISFQDGLTKPEILYGCLFVLFAVASLCIATLLFPASFTPVSKLISWVLSIYLQLKNPIRHTETGRSIPGPNYVWPNGQGDVEKYVQGRTRSEQWQQKYGNVYRIWAGMTPEVSGYPPALALDTTV